MRRLREAEVKADFNLLLLREDPFAFRRREKKERQLIQGQKIINR